MGHLFPGREQGGHCGSTAEQMQTELRKNTVCIQTGKGGARRADSTTGPLKRIMGMQAVLR